MVIVEPDSPLTTFTLAHCTQQKVRQNCSQGVHQAQDIFIASEIERNLFPNVVRKRCGTVQNLTRSADGELSVSTEHQFMHVGIIHIYSFI